MALMPSEECARRPGALPPKRMVASWSGPHAGPTEYKVAAQGSRAMAGSPRFVLLLSFWIDTVALRPPGRTYCNASRDELTGAERRETWAMKPGPKPLLGTTMTHAERQARYRASHAEGAPKLRYRNPADRRSRPQRWRDAVAELLELQGDYQAWLDALPENLADSATADALRVICDLDLSELASVESPRGFGRD